MGCTNPEIGKLIGRYEFGLLSDEEKKRFALHLMECDDCFEELYSLTPAVNAMRDNPELYLAELKEKKSFSSKLKEIWDNTVETFGAVFRPRPRLVRIAVPVVATAALAFVLITTFVDRPGDYARLAVIEKDFYRPLELRTGVDYEDYEIRFHEGMMAYSEGDYARAIEELSASVKLNPDHAQGQFYLGLSLLMEKKTDRAIQHLEQVTALADEVSLLEKTHWYLGNAYLRKDNESRALIEFRKVIEFRGRFLSDAEGLIQMIEKIRNEKGA